MSRIEGYYDLLSKTYDEAVHMLLEKYGKVQDDYFRKNSYSRFLKGEIKSITRGKYSRTKDGLYCHHIDEDKLIDLSSNRTIWYFKPPFKYHKKERLVYCDLVEHLTLHTILAEETEREFGWPGYQFYLKPSVIDWYVKEKIPKPAWMKNCFQKAFLTSSEAIDFLRSTENKLGECFFDSPSEFFEYEKQQKIKAQEEKKQRENELKRENRERAKLQRRERLNQLKKESASFHKKYPDFKKIDIDLTTSRKKIIELLYNYKYFAEYDSIKEFDVAMKPLIRDKLIDELHSLI